jgi:hypothetical protein
MKRKMVTFLNMGHIILIKFQKFIQIIIVNKHELVAPSGKLWYNKCNFLVVSFPIPNRTHLVICSSLYVQH